MRLLGNTARLIRHLLGILVGERVKVSIPVKFKRLYLGDSRRRYSPVSSSRAPRCRRAAARNRAVLPFTQFPSLSACLLACLLAYSLVRARTNVPRLCNQVKVAQAPRRAPPSSARAPNGQHRTAANSHPPWYQLQPSERSMIDRSKGPRISRISSRPAFLLKAPSRILLKWSSFPIKGIACSLRRARSKMKS